MTVPADVAGVADDPSADLPQARSNVDRTLLVATVAAVVMFALVGLVFVLRGRLNVDEGWYLDASRLVFHGQIPFRDFGFTQMPLSPYVYGLPQLLGPSIVLGRLTSLLFVVAAVGLAVRVTWRAVGRYAALAVAVLCLAFPTGIYNLTLVKTYALSACPARRGARRTDVAGAAEARAAVGGRGSRRARRSRGRPASC